MPLGAQMSLGGSISRRAKYCPNGGMAFADWLAAGHHARCGAGGDNHAPRCPLCCPFRSARFAGKYRWGQQFAPFGGSNGLVCLFAQRDRVLPQRGVTLAPALAQGRPHRSPRSRRWVVWERLGRSACRATLASRGNSYEASAVSYVEETGVASGNDASVAAGDDIGLRSEEEQSELPSR